MPLFFFLSGAVLRLKPIEKLKVFIMKKVKRLLIPYLMVGYLFMLPVKFLSGFYSLEGFEQALKVLWRGIDSGHLWFLTSLFWDTVIFAILYKILQKIHLEKIVLLLALVLQCTYHWIPKDILGLVNGLSMIFWFALGFEFESKRKSIKKYPIYFWIGLLSIGIVLDILLSQYAIVPDFVIIFVRGFLTCVLAYIADFCLKSITRTRIYQFVVAHLFDIYLYHDPLEYLILLCFFKWGIVFFPGGEYLLVFTRIFGTIVLSVMIGWGINKLVKRKGRRYEK